MQYLVPDRLGEAAGNHNRGHIGDTPCALGFGGSYNWIGGGTLTMPWTISQALDDFGRENLGNLYDLFKGWLETIFGKTVELDEYYFWVGERDRPPTLNLLALTGVRVWKVTLSRGGYSTMSLRVVDISIIRLEYNHDRGTLTFAIRWAGAESSHEVPAGGKAAERLIGFYRAIARPTAG